MTDASQSEVGHHLRMVPRSGWYRVWCACGWTSQAYPDEEQALIEGAGHLPPVGQPPPTDKLDS